jgi:hypothetical protein
VIRLRLRVTDDLGAYAEDLIDVTVQNGASGNQPPTANAGPDQSVDELTSVSLNGSGSDPESGAISYLWSQVSGPAVTLSATNIANPTFTAPSVSSDGIVRLRLRVTDDQGAFAEDLIDINVNDVGSGGNNPPTANAGPDQTVNEQVLVSLSGSGTDPESGLLTYAWTQVSGPSITFSNAGIANPTFTAPFVNSNQLVRLRLRVTDDQGAFAEDLIDVTVQNGASGNQDPAANAGPDQTVTERALVSLNGSGSDPENGAVAYLWTQVSGPAVTLSAGNVANPTFTAPFVNANQVVRLRLRVTDDQGAFAEDLIDVTVQNGGFGNQTPAANAGPDQTINELLVVSLNGSGTDPEGGVLTYLWSQISGPAVTLSANNIANPTFSAPAVAAVSVVRLQLRVSDDQGAFADDIVDVTVNDADGSGNAPPAITILSPTNLSYVRGGSIPIDIRATDDVGVTQVRVKIDGGAEQVAGANGINLYRYSWNTNSPTSEGSHTIEAIARDLQPLATMQMITVLVDRTMPTIALTPNNGVIVQGNVNIQTTATDDRALVFAEIVIDGTQVTSRNVTGTSTAFTYSWDTLGLPEGTHQILVRAVDAAGNIFTRLHDVTVRNLGGANPLPDFTWMTPAPFTPPAIAPRIRGSAPLQVNVTVGDPILSVQFSLDGTPLVGPVVNTPGTGIWTYSLDTTAGYADGNHTLSALVTNAEGSTSKSVTAFIDNTPPTITIDSPSNNQILYLVNNLIARANDNGNPIDEVLFEINTVGVALRPGNANPVNDTYTYQMDTEALLPDGTRRWPDSPYVPPATPNYTLTVTAFDKARNQASASITFGIDNAHIPAAPGAVVVFNPTGFVSGNAGNEIWADVQNVAIDPSSFNNQGTRALQVFVKRNSSDDFERLEMPVRLVGNRMIIDEPMPANAEYQLVARVMGTTGLIQASATGIKAMDDATGGTVSSADGLLLLNIPPNSLTRDLYLRIPKMTSRPNWMEQADLSFNQLYEGHSVVAGPYQVEGRTSMTGGAIFDEVVESEIGVRHQIPTSNIPPTLQSMLLQIQEARQTADSNFWHPLGTSNSSTQNSSFRTVNGTTRRLGIFRVTRFAAPGSGVTEVFNYSNPFHPDEGPTNITYMLGDPEDVTLVIYDSLGNLVKRQTFPAGTPGGALGPNTIQWDGRNGSGDFVASGSYIARLIAGSSKAVRKIGVVR